MGFVVDVCLSRSHFILIQIPCLKNGPHGLPYFFHTDSVSIGNHNADSIDCQTFLHATQLLAHATPIKTLIYYTIKNPIFTNTKTLLTNINIRRCIK